MSRTLVLEPVVARVGGDPVATPPFVKNTTIVLDPYMRRIDTTVDQYAAPGVVS